MDILTPLMAIPDTPSGVFPQVRAMGLPMQAATTLNHFICTISHLNPPDYLVPTRTYALLDQFDPDTPGEALGLAILQDNSQLLFPQPRVDFITKLQGPILGPDGRRGRPQLWILSTPNPTRQPLSIHQQSLLRLLLTPQQFDSMRNRNDPYLQGTKSLAFWYRKYHNGTSPWDPPLINPSSPRDPLTHNPPPSQEPNAWQTTSKKGKSNPRRTIHQYYPPPTDTTTTTNPMTVVQYLNQKRSPQTSTSSLSDSTGALTTTPMHNMTLSPTHNPGPDLLFQTLNEVLQRVKNLEHTDERLRALELEVQQLRTGTTPLQPPTSQIAAMQIDDPIDPPTSEPATKIQKILTNDDIDDKDL